MVETAFETGCDGVQGEEDHSSPKSAAIGPACLQDAWVERRLE